MRDREREGEREQLQQLPAEQPVQGAGDLLQAGDRFALHSTRLQLLAGGADKLERLRAQVTHLWHSSNAAKVTGAPVQTLSAGHLMTTTDAAQLRKR